ncbi:hypothetical protein VN97_g8715, partial [Penicillium thymicola]
GCHLTLCNRTVVSSPSSSFSLLLLQKQLAVSTSTVALLSHSLLSASHHFSFRHPLYYITYLLISSLTSLRAEKMFMAIHMPYKVWRERGTICRLAMPSAQHTFRMTLRSIVVLICGFAAITSKKVWLIKYTASALEAKAVD